MTNAKRCGKIVERLRDWRAQESPRETAKRQELLRSSRSETVEPGESFGPERERKLGGLPKRRKPKSFNPEGN